VSNDLLNHPDVVKTIRNELLRGGYPKHEIEDGVSEVKADVLEYLLKEKIEVETPDRMSAIVRAPSRQKGIDAMRASSRRGRMNTGSTDTEDEHAADQVSAEARVDHRKAVALVRDNLDGEEKQIVEGMLAGKSLKQTAEEIGVSHDRVRKKKVTMLTRSRSLLRSAGLLGAIGGFVVLGVILYKAYAPNDEAKRQPAPPPPTQTVAPPVPSPQVPVATITPEQAKAAAALREEAHQAATKKKWHDCNDAYGKAAEIDWSGETDAQKAESAKCAREYFNSLNAKP